MSTVHFKINCGYARVAIREYSEVGRGKGHCDTVERAHKFKELFSPSTTYINDATIFDGYGHRDSKFDRYCKGINGMFRKWSDRDSKQQYISHFSSNNWKQLSLKQKKRHSLANCKECAISHREQQTTFPGAMYNPATPIADSLKNILESNNDSATTTTKQILGEIQPVFEKAYGKSFTDTLATCPGSGLQIKPTAADNKKLKRKLRRECRDHISTQLQENDALTVLAEGQSIASYKRMRFSQSFETAEQKRERAQATPLVRRKHSPNFDNVQWDKGGLLNRLQNWPEGEVINWTQLGREWNVPGENKGQTVKEYAMECGIDVEQLDHRPPNTRMRARHLKLPGGEISVPVHKSVRGIKDDWEGMINNGELSLGEPCFPHTLTRYSIKEGQIQHSNISIYGRKIPLLELRQKLLTGNSRQTGNTLGT